MKSDEQIQKNVLDKLEFTPEIFEQDKIAISVHDGLVTLGGVTTNYAQKLSIERAVKTVKDVTGIINEIKVEALPQYKKDDVSIAKAATEALAWDTTVPHEQIKITVEDGLNCLAK